MKLLYIANLRLPTEKAYGIQIAKMCEAFAVSGLDVELVHPSRNNLIKEDFFSYYSIDKAFKIKELWAPDVYLPGRFDKLAVNVKGFISAFVLFIYGLASGADVIYSRDEWPLYLLSFFKKNIVFEMHNFSNARSIFYKRFLKKNIKVVTISRGLKDRLLNFGFSADDVFVAHDGVDLTDFDIQISKEEARRRLNFPQDAKIVLYTGHLFIWKGAGVLAESARLFTGAIFVFVGGTEHDINIFKSKFGDIPNISIIGHRPHKEIPIFLKVADVMVLPNSGKEETSNSPLKLFEYMASGRPIVASDLPAIREVLNEKNSVLVKPNDSNSLAEGIKKIFNNNIFGDEIARVAKIDIENYTWQKRADKIVNFILR